MAWQEPQQSEKPGLSNGEGGEGPLRSPSREVQDEDMAEDMSFEDMDEPQPEPMPRSTPTPEQEEPSLTQRFKEQLSGVLPTLSRMAQATGKLEIPKTQRFKEQLSGVLPTLLRRVPTQAKQKLAPNTTTGQTSGNAETSFLERLQHFFMGEQQHRTTAAALIETPLRVQPKQNYSIRIHVMGREEPKLPPGAKRDTPAAGLSALIHGEVIHIEVRSTLYQNLAYIVQRAGLQLPGQGYAAEVTIPMQSPTSSLRGHRERLHIFFTDEMGNPLYEKPFIVELFVSPLVQPGHEGHHVLPIPL
jgi:hypothetical protein